MIINNLQLYKSRYKPERQIKYAEGNRLTKEKKEKLYDYYICDYCGSEIKIEDKWENKQGGLLKIPQTLSKIDQVFYLALCNKCVKSVVKELEEKNYNHIPRID